MGYQQDVEAWRQRHHEEITRAAAEDERRRLLDALKERGFVDALGLYQEARCYYGAEPCRLTAGKRDTAAVKLAELVEALFVELARTRVRS
jgi:hypothetical protein